MTRSDSRIGFFAAMRGAAARATGVVGFVAATVLGLTTFAGETHAQDVFASSGRVCGYPGYTYDMDKVIDAARGYPNGAVVILTPQEKSDLEDEFRTWNEGGGQPMRLMAPCFNCSQDYEACIVFERGGPPGNWDEVFNSNGVPPPPDPGGDDFGSNGGQGGGSGGSGPSTEPPADVPYCGLLEDLAEISQIPIRNLADAMEYRFTPRTLETLSVDLKQTPLDPAIAWKAPGVKTSRCNLGCFGSAIAQDLRWRTGQPFIALPRRANIGGWSPDDAEGGALRDDVTETLHHEYGSWMSFGNYSLGDAKMEQALKAGWRLEVDRAWIETTMRMLGERGERPRGIVLVNYPKGVQFGHAFNVRWLPDGTSRMIEHPFCSKPIKTFGGRVEFWDPSTGAEASWDSVVKIYFYPTN